VGLARKPAVLSLIALVTVLGGCAGRSAQPPVPEGNTSPPETLRDDQGVRLAPLAFSSRFQKAAYILVGEQHPNPCDHAAQAAILRRLVRSGIRPVIGLEMVPADRQDILDAFNRGKLAVGDLPRALDWPKTWGFDFALYAPIFEVARACDLPVFALNAPAGLARKVGHQGIGALSPAERAALPGDIIPPAPAQLETLREIQAMHAAMLAPKGRPGRDPFAAFLTVQSLWDTQMASRARYARAFFGRPVVILAGTGHVEGGFGIARRLTVLDPGATSISILPWRGGPPPEAGTADVFFSCPAGKGKRPPAAGGMMPPDPSHQRQIHKLNSPGAAHEGELENKVPVRGDRGE